MELPQKFEINHEFHDTATSKIMSKINELIDYLESQKEGEEPKQIDVQALLSEYEELGHDVENEDSELAKAKRREIINTLKQALQQ